MERMWRSGVVYFNEIFQHFLGGTAENKRNKVRTASPSRGLKPRTLGALTNSDNLYSAMFGNLLKSSP
jgi:hypothetical protein